MSAGREAHAKYHFSLEITSIRASEIGNTRLRHGSVVLFQCVGFRRDDAAEIFMFTDKNPNFS